MTLSDVALYPVRIPMTVRFRRVTWREALLIEGPAGWGEFSPFPDYPPTVTTRWLASALESAIAGHPEPVRSSVPVNVTVPAIDPDAAHAHVADSGCMTAKVKVADHGESFSDDVARVRAVRDALGSEGSIRIDVNGAWTVDDAVERIERLNEFRLEYVEQPVATIDELARLRRLVSVPIAADESVRQAPDPLEVARRDAADVLVLKVQPLGGIARTLDIGSRSGLPVVISSALETSVGLAAGVAAAAALPELPYACGLATGVLLEGDVTETPLVPVNGLIDVRRPQPDEDLLDEWAADRETESRLMQRLRDAADLLT